MEYIKKVLTDEMSSTPFHQHFENISKKKNEKIKTLLKMISEKKEINVNLYKFYLNNYFILILYYFKVIWNEKSWW